MKPFSSSFVILNILESSQGELKILEKRELKEIGVTTRSGRVKGGVQDVMVDGLIVFLYF